MRLLSLFNDSEIKELLADQRLPARLGDVKVFGVTEDSRQVKRGYLFVAIKGLKTDGHRYISSALANGAAVVVYEDEISQNFNGDRTLLIRVRNSRKALGLLITAWYGFPSRKLKVIGVTGTDGKTTTTNLIYHILKTWGKSVGMVSTIKARIGEKEVDTGFHVTNPTPEVLQKLLSQMVRKGMEYAVLEVTSHGVDQERIAGIQFLGAVITNVTHEHLDYHKTYQSYLKTKSRLFEKVKFSVLNRGDKSFDYLKSVASGRIVSYGLIQAADITASKIDLRGTVSHFYLSFGSLKPPEHIRLRLPGRYNVSNALAAAAACYRLGLSPRQIKAGLETFRRLEGRFDEVRLGQAFRVIIDFAHTPNALEEVLGLCQEIKSKEARLICVFGCAGERDRQKRPTMGQISGRLADASVLTAEDPRRENVEEIIDQMARGCLASGSKEVQETTSEKAIEQIKTHVFIRIPGRREAIRWAIQYSKAGDLVIVTGKGHEKSMCYGQEERPWSDRKVVEGELRKLGFGK